MCVITALVDIRTPLEPAFNDYIDTVINSRIHSHLSVSFICFLFVITLWHTTDSHPPETFLFIQHRSCLFFFGFSSFQHLASWLSSLPEPHLVDLCDSQLHRNESSKLAAALVLIRLSLSLVSLLFSLTTHRVSATFRVSQRPLVWRRNTMLKWLRWMQMHVKCSMFFKSFTTREASTGSAIRFEPRTRETSRTRLKTNKQAWTMELNRTHTRIAVAFHVYILTPVEFCSISIKIITLAITQRTPRRWRPCCQSRLPGDATITQKQQHFPHVHKGMIVKCV